MSERPTDTLPRCCPSHHDWSTLLDHLAREFTTVGRDVVVRELATAREATQAVALGSADALFVAELVARNQLLILSGRLPDAARLDPEHHQRAAPAPASAPAAAPASAPAAAPANLSAFAGAIAPADADNPREPGRR